MGAAEDTIANREAEVEGAFIPLAARGAGKIQGGVMKLDGNSIFSLAEGTVNRDRDFHNMVFSPNK